MKGHKITLTNKGHKVLKLRFDAGFEYDRKSGLFTMRAVSFFKDEQDVEKWVAKLLKEKCNYTSKDYKIVKIEEEL